MLNSECVLILGEAVLCGIACCSTPLPSTLWANSMPHRSWGAGKEHRACWEMHEQTVVRLREGILLVRPSSSSILPTSVFLRLSAASLVYSERYLKNKIKSMRKILQLEAVVPNSITCHARFGVIFHIHGVCECVHNVHWYQTQSISPSCISTQIDISPFAPYLIVMFLCLACKCCCRGAACLSTPPPPFLLFPPFQLRCRQR